MVKLFFTSMICLILTGHFIAQNPYAHYSFDNCSFEDQQGNLSDLRVFGNPECVCAPVNNGMSVNGMNEMMELDSQMGNIISGDFSLSFYLHLGAVQGPQLMDIITNEKVCFGDSSFVVQYDPLSSTLNVYFIITPANRVALKCQLDPNQCWHQMVITKERVFFSLYRNGELADEATYDKGVRVNISSDRPFRIGNGTCKGQKFNGALDEIKLYNERLTPGEIEASYVPVDKILTRDTVVVLGDAITPKVSGSCANAYTWMPDDGTVSDINEIMPEIAPEVSETYILQFFQQGCIARDTLNIVVVDPDDVQCDRLLLPTAFTPNGDGVNDVFGISNAYIIDELNSFDIFDKWGGVVFSTNDKDALWDGFYKNKALNPGVFLYKITYQCNGRNYIKKGGFSILR